MTLFGYLAIGTVLMVGVSLIANLAYGVNRVKIAALAVILTLAGLFGAKLMALIESGSWSGKSFFGALFFAPIVMIPAALLFRERIATVLDICAPSECVMLALLKVQCMMDGCCYGKVMRISAVGEAIRFPSQTVECVNALVLMVILLLMTRNRRLHGTLYPWYMILYGVTRYVLNLYRDTRPFVGNLAAGNFWSIISFGLGVLVLAGIMIHRRRKAAA